MSYTPGPWKVELDCDGKFMDVSGPDDKSIIRLGYDSYTIEMDNANLIACAPELLEALEEIFYEHSYALENDDDSSGKSDALYIKIKKLLDRATGDIG